MDVTQHDPLGQNAEENEAHDQVLEEIVGEDEVKPAEEAALNTDNDVAEEATNKTSVTDEELALEQELAEIEPVKAEKKTKKAEKTEDTAEEAPVEEQKHKNRESTSEKAKKAAAKRVEKGLSAEPAKKLDPLRLRGKKYRKVAGLVDKTKVYSIEEAVTLVKQLSTANFDAAVEVHAKVKTDTVRGTVTLPHGTGKTKKVAVADDETIEAIAAGKLDFDVLIATPAQMPKLAKFAKVLGPKGLMPSPKAGTVTDDIETVRNEISGGRIEYRADKNSVVHLAIGRVSFADEKLVENFKAIEHVLIPAKLLSVSLAPTMGPGVKISLTAA